jgi:hypothetical protein
MKVAQKVDHYIDQLPDAEKEVAEYIRELIFGLIPNVEERYSFNLPFYHYFGMFCYFNRIKKGGGIELVFCRGKDLVMAFPELQVKGRAIMAGITFRSIKEIDKPLLQSLLAGAAAWQLEAHQAQKPFMDKTLKKKRKG